MPATNLPLNELVTTSGMDFFHRGTPLQPARPEHYATKAYVDGTVAGSEPVGCNLLLVPGTLLFIGSGQTRVERGGHVFQRMDGVTDVDFEQFPELIGVNGLVPSDDGGTSVKFSLVQAVSPPRSLPKKSLASRSP
ncbi:MAG: hypothetical protein FWC43_14215 [Planctomycetaceae bacterium]|nr:hypothetical protein [Planctomycetaceae bacterium]